MSITLLNQEQAFILEELNNWINSNYEELNAKDYFYIDSLRDISQHYMNRIYKEDEIKATKSTVPYTPIYTKINKKINIDIADIGNYSYCPLLVFETGDDTGIFKGYEDQREPRKKEILMNIYEEFIGWQSSGTRNIFYSINKKNRLSYGNITAKQLKRVLIWQNYEPFFNQFDKKNKQTDFGHRTASEILKILF